MFYKRCFEWLQIYEFFFFIRVSLVSKKFFFHFFFNSKYYLNLHLSSSCLCHQSYGYRRCHHWSPSHVEEHNQLCSSEPPKDPNSLSSHLTTFYFRGYSGIENEVEFVKFILKESRLLKTMTVEVGYMPKEGVLEKLSMFPRSLAHVYLQLNELSLLKGMVSLQMVAIK